MYDLLIIGGGPAGTAAAITAARRGRRVVLLERGRFPRHKVCGEFVSPESISVLESLLQRSPELRLNSVPRITAARLFIDEQVLSTVVDPAAASVSRHELDHALWQAAVRAGVDARQQCTVKEISGDGSFAVSTSEERFEARCVIHAAGRWSNLRHASQPNLGGVKWLGVKAHFAEAEPAPSVDLYFFEHGYCGVQPGQNCGVNVCAMVRSDVATSLPEVFRRSLPLEKRSRGWQPLTEVVSTSPLLFRKPEPIRGNVLNVGDAAAFIDPFVGDGISLALRSGTLAADCLACFLDGEDTLETAAENYRRQYNEQLLGVFRTSSKIRRLLALPYPARAALLMLFGNIPALTRYFVRRTR